MHCDELGDDTLLGGDGNDTIRSGIWWNSNHAGDDILDGGAGDDWLWADGPGNDTLTGGAGDDILERGPHGRGNNTFVFGAGHGNDTVKRFTHGQDSIDLTAFGLSGFSSLKMSPTSGGTMIDLESHGGGTILLAGVDLADLDASDFAF